jgi:hypothetical protein
MNERWRLLPLLSVLVGTGLSCSDPIQSGRVEDLGKEITGVDKGEFHRAGQPCIVCHAENGPADSVFTIAGTVLAGPQSQVGVANAEVRMTDSLSTTHIAKTNCVGNFFVKPVKDDPDGWDPKFPILVAVAKGGTLRRMNSVIGREPSCGTCHTTRADRDPSSQLIQVYLFGTEEIGAAPVPCPVNPKLD